MAERFQVDLRGIIELASNHMYTSSNVVVRELIQNAVDAITARRTLEPAHVGGVRLELTKPGDGMPTLCVSDDGIGLTRDEVEMFLSTVGGSSKRTEEDAEKVAEEGGFLGRFGIGLLSCFMVSDEIVVVTRSARAKDSPAIEWRGRADGSYTIRETPASALSQGTSVFLTSKPSEDWFFEHDHLVEQAKKYAEMLPVRIAFTRGGEEVAINRAAAPWDMGVEDGVALDDYCQGTLGFRPLDAFPVETPDGSVKGLVFIRADKTTGWYGGHQIYARGMHVSEHSQGLVPEWARFTSCVLNASGLRLTASRESLHRDAALEKAQEHLAGTIRKRFAHLLRHDRAKFAAIMLVHDSDIRGLAVKDPEFLELIIDLLEFETTLGAIRFGEFRREHETLLVARTAEQYRRIAPIAARVGLRVFNGGYTYHEELLSRGVQRHPELVLRAFDSSDLLDGMDTPADAEAYRGLAEAGSEALRESECEVVIREFEPASTPAFFALGATQEFHRELDQTKSRASQVWNEILDAMAPRSPELAPTRLCLNARSPVVRRLANAADADLARIAVQVLYAQALMAGHYPLTSREMGLLSSGMEQLLARISDGHRP